MPNATQITLAASQLSDVTVDEVYKVVDRSDGRVTFRGVDANVPLSLVPRAIVRVQQPNGNSKYGKVEVDFILPERYTDADTSLSHEQLLNRATVTFKVDKGSTPDQAKRMVERALAFIGSAEIVTAATELESFF
jgi:hypothetical protein